MFNPTGMDHQKNSPQLGLLIASYTRWVWKFDTVVELGELYFIIWIEVYLNRYYTLTCADWGLKNLNIMAVSDTINGWKIKQMSKTNTISYILALCYIHTYMRGSAAKLVPMGKVLLHREQHKECWLASKSKHWCQDHTQWARSAIAKSRQKDSSYILASCRQHKSWPCRRCFPEKHRSCAWKSSEAPARVAAMSHVATAPGVFGRSPQT